MRQILKPLHLACGSSEEQPNHQLIHIKDKVATATNGSILVKIDLSVTSHLQEEDLKVLNGKYLHKETWKELHKCDDFKITKKSIDIEKNGVTKTMYFAKPQGELDILDPVANVKDAGEESKRIISFSGGQIDIIHRIFQVDTLNFSFSKKDEATVVFPSTDSGMFALIKPLEQLELNRYIFNNL